MSQPVLWARFKAFAKKLAPSRAIRWTFIYVPAFTFAILFALKAIGGLDDLVAYVMEAGSRSVHVLVAIAIVYGVATGLGWNLDNAKRADYQRILIASNGKNYGAFAVLAGETVAILALLYLILRAMDLMGFKP